MLLPDPIARSKQVSFLKMASVITKLKRVAMGAAGIILWCRPNVDPCCLWLSGMSRAYGARMPIKQLMLLSALKRFGDYHSLEDSTGGRYRAEKSSYAMMKAKWLSNLLIPRGGK